MLNQVTAIAEEVCWDFVTQATTTKMSFSGFCTEMSRKYQTTHPFCDPFVSHKTLKKCLLAWICKMNIDYRKEIDPFCKYEPTMLACDGTHVGIGARHYDLHKCTTDPDKPDIKLPSHKRLKRLFIASDEARDFLLFLTKMQLGQAVDQALKDYYTGVTLGTNLQILDSEVDNLGKAGISAMMCTFLGQTKPYLMKSVAEIFQLLSASQKSCLSSIFPFRYHVELRTTCDAFLQGNGTEAQLKRIRKYLPPAANLLAVCEANNSIDLAVNFLKDFIDLTIAVHAQDTPVPPLSYQPNGKPGTYNPPKGSAYYFTPHGGQVRDTPTYEVSGESKSDNDSCRKMYPQVSLGGYGYLFLYFCPQHGHCYGFHLIKGGRGGKMPFIHY